MNNSKLLIIGAGGHSKACIDIIEQNSDFKICGLIGQRHETGKSILGYSVIGHDEDLPDLKHAYGSVFIGVGQIKSADLRVRLFEDVTRLKFDIPKFISRSASVSKNAYIGSGTIVMRGAIVGPGAKVGDNCIVNSQALIEHDVVVGNHCHISTGAKINGAARIGDRSFIGSGAILKQELEVGVECIVGMGVALAINLPDRSVYMGD